MIEIKQGSTLAFSGVHTDKDNVAVSLDGITIEADMKLATVRQPFTVTKAVDQVAQPGEFILNIDNTTTATLPLGKYDCDLKYSEGSVVTRTDTFVIEVVKAVTL